MADNTSNFSLYTWTNAVIIFGVYFILHLSFGAGMHKEVTKDSNTGVLKSSNIDISTGLGTCF